MTTEQLAITVTADTDSIAAVRHFIRAAAHTLMSSVDLDVAELLASELAANAVALDAGEVTITVSAPGRGLRVEVRDFGYGRPLVSRPAPTDTRGGRGLLLVERLATQWGVDEFLPGKIVWFELRGLPAASPTASPRPPHSAGGSSARRSRRSTSVRRMMRDRYDWLTPIRSAISGWLRLAKKRSRMTSRSRSGSSSRS